jgi:hypothetical protein
MHLSYHKLQSKVAAFAFVLTLLNLWLLLDGYHGLIGDAQIYAFQALARIYPQFTSDLFLQNTSQDHFTIFSPFYAWFIGNLGLENAARLLTLIFAAWFMLAAWSAARAVASREEAWFAVAFLLIIAGSYGGAGVFKFADQFLTARLPAEALIVTSLALHLRDRKRLALAIAVATMFVHPLIALSGLLFLICLSMPSRVIIVGAGAGALMTLLLAIGAANFTAISRVLPTMDSAWLNVVRERSQFLFLQLWSFRDWNLNARPFLSLAATLLVVQDARVRKLCVCAVLVGITGLAVALIASVVGPVAILVQGQAWRAVWITVFISVLLLPVAARQALQDRNLGPLCTILLVCGWTLQAVDGTACISLAVVFLILRAHFGTRLGHLLRWLPAAFAVAIIIWIFFQSHGMVVSAAKAAIEIAAVLGVVLIWWLVRVSRTMWIPTFLSAALVASTAFFLPTAFKQTRVFGAATDVAEFSDWRSAIPLTSSVLVVPSRDVGSFVWFTLQRPNYLALNQSAGVVFSRATALEVQRRSEVLLPVMSPNWKILTSLRNAAAGKHNMNPETRPLTEDNLRQICIDQQLGFVVSRESLGIEHLGHKHPGPWTGWNLFDCRTVRASLSDRR